jgi:probable F420-dependent oxidoreductase
MEFGLRMLPTEYSMRPAALARAAEERGFASLWVPEHSHIPVSRRTPFPSGPKLPEEYRHSLDPFVALTAAASVTERLQVGMGICLVVERDPILLAKEVASLDVVSDGRLLFGIGAGWNREEMENHGTNPDQKWDVLRERLAAVKAIWANEEAEYHGEHVDFDPIWQWPKPVQRPHPPVLLGGDAPGAIRRAVELADEWIPHPRRTPEALARKIDELQDLAAKAGRGPIPVSLYGVALDTDAATFEARQRLEIKRCVLNLPSAGPDEVLPLLDRGAKIAAAYK